jgi:hypothetical protein
MPVTSPWLFVTNSKVSFAAHNWDGMLEQLRSIPMHVLMAAQLRPHEYVQATITHSQMKYHFCIALMSTLSLCFTSFDSTSEPAFLRTFKLPAPAAEAASSSVRTRLNLAPIAPSLCKEFCNFFENHLVLRYIRDREDTLFQEGFDMIVSNVAEWAPAMGLSLKRLHAELTASRHIPAKFIAHVRQCWATPRALQYWPSLVSPSKRGVVDPNQQDQVLQLGPAQCGVPRVDMAK